MPHIVVKLYAGKTDEQKSELTRKIVEVFMTTLGNSEASLSVGIEEYDPKDWKEHVVVPDIEGKMETLTKKPGYL
jgi:4-oxalocrotonate tautomerase